MIDVEVGPGTTARPASMSSRTASEIVQSAVYTLRDASGRQDAQVQFFREGVPAASVLGIPATEPIAQGRVVDVLSRMNISTPAVEGQRSRRDVWSSAGTSNGLDGTVVVRLVRRTASGQQTVLTKSAAASGTGDPDRLYPWRVALDTSKLRPGHYLVVATNDDPSGHGNAATDTRVVVLK